MKSEKGVTLTSLIIYIIVMLVVIGIISIISTFFYNNIDEVGKNIDPSQQFTRFSSFFLKDINKTDRNILECSEEGDYIVISNGTQYTFKNNSVYRGKVKICEGIESLKFENESNAIKVIYKLTDDTEEKTALFAINSEEGPTVESNITFYIEEHPFTVPVGSDWSGIMNRIESTVLQYFSIPDHCSANTGQKTEFKSLTKDTWCVSGGYVPENAVSLHAVCNNHSDAFHCFRSLLYEGQVVKNTDSVVPGGSYTWNELKWQFVYSPF